MCKALSTNPGTEESRMQLRSFTIVAFFVVIIMITATSIKAIARITNSVCDDLGT